MSQICFRNITYGHGGLPLVESGNAVIEVGDRVCIIGRNGVGKSTLMRLLLDSTSLEHGVIEMSPGCRLAMLPQAIPTGIDKTVEQMVAEGLEDTHFEEWDRQHRVEKILSKMQLPAMRAYEDLSGGLKRRVLLAKTLVKEPDVLLLDEPTNHLDIDAILWLEQFLLQFNKTIIFITHDRELMQSLSTHILDIDNGRIISWRGHYQDYLKHKDDLLNAEAKANALFDRRLAQEETWIRQGIKARRTRNEGRVRALKAMRQQRQERRQRLGTVKFTTQSADLSGKIVFEVNQAAFSYQENLIINPFSWICLRGDKVGIIGANGSGKSTLINLLLDRLKPESGTIKRGTNLDIAYFDQQQHALEEDKTLAENIAGGSDTVTIGDQKKHIISYLQDFLFAPERARKPIKALSGGERNRALLAKLFLKPCNLLVMDEPTNDLDIETLELLEEKLTEYNGTLLLVSHDRAFLNNIVTSTLVLPGNGQVEEYAGGYDDYLQQRKAPISRSTPSNPVKKSQPTTATLSRDERRELNNIGKRIEKLEQQLQALHNDMATEAFYQQSPPDIASAQESAQKLEQTIQHAYERWEVLEAKQNG